MWLWGCQSVLGPNKENVESQLKGINGWIKIKQHRNQSKCGFFNPKQPELISIKITNLKLHWQSKNLQALIKIAKLPDNSASGRGTRGRLLTLNHHHLKWQTGRHFEPVAVISVGAGDWDTCPSSKLRWDENKYTVDTNRHTEKKGQGWM